MWFARAAISGKIESRSFPAKVGLGICTASAPYPRLGGGNFLQIAGIPDFCRLQGLLIYQVSAVRRY